MRWWNGFKLTSPEFEGAFKNWASCRGELIRKLVNNQISPAGAFGAPLTPELELLFLAVRPQFDADARARIWELLKAPLNWDWIASLARTHGVLPLLYERLNPYVRFIQPDVCEAMASYAQMRTRRSLVLMAELVRLFDWFEAEAIPLLAFKGPVLATVAYGNLSRRAFNDLDVLVPFNEVSHAWSVLQAQGYVPDEHFSPAQFRAFLASDNHHAFRQANGDIIIELHWRLLSKAYAITWKEARIWERAIGVTLGGRAIRTLLPSDAILFTCI
ncbi:MAG TPA: nucleotidyltransferase family protein, partial [Anaerolineae bacterium]|nr:nucleotidyltransferase family protein [Anaerolineae bacterium]